MKKHFYIFLSSLFFFTLLVNFCNAAISDADEVINQTAYFAGTAGFDGDNSDKEFVDTVSAFIRTFLSFLGIIFLVLMLYGGFTWMTAGGEEAKVETAKKTIQRAVIGLLIIATSYAVTYSVFRMLE